MHKSLCIHVPHQTWSSCVQDIIYYIITITELVFGDFQIFVLSDQDSAVLIGTIRFFIIYLQGTQKMPNIHLIIIAYLVPDIKSYGNLPISVLELHYSF